MKKTTIIFVALFFGVFYDSFGQSTDEIRKQLYEASENEQILKEFDSNIKPYGESKNSIVLSKNTVYKWHTHIKDPKKIQVTLYDSQENILFQNTPEQKGIVNFTTKCNKTGVNHLVIENMSDSEIHNILLLKFSERLEENVIVSKKSDIQQESPNIEFTDKEESYYFVVDEMPKFKGKSGNFDEFKKFIAQELKYPQDALAQKIEGRVFIQFVIGKEGYIKEAKIARGVHPALDQEALRVVYSSPRWEPGIKDNKSVNVVFTFPIGFKLQ